MRTTAILYMTRISKLAHIEMIKHSHGDSISLLGCGDTQFRCTFMFRVTTAQPLDNYCITTPKGMEPKEGIILFLRVDSD